MATREFITLQCSAEFVKIGVLAMYIVIEHCLIAIHAARLKVLHNDFFRSCADDEGKESAECLICECPALGKGDRDLDKVANVSATFDILRRYNWVNGQDLGKLDYSLSRWYYNGLKSLSQTAQHYK